MINGIVGGHALLFEKNISVYYLVSSCISCILQYQHINVKCKFIIVLVTCMTCALFIMLLLFFFNNNSVHIKWKGSGDVGHCKIEVNS